MLPAGTRLGAYEIVSAIGAGGMGEVYRARDTALGRDVAIKILPEAFARDPERLARFEREARTLASLNHPNIAHIYGLEGVGSGLPPLDELGASRAGRGAPGETRPPALVMELAEGEDLSARIARGPVPVPEALAIASRIADALEAAHEQGIIHRDLKPANVKVTDDGVVKVLDFGLAKAFAPDAPGAASNATNSPTLTARATQMGTIIGTAAYMAPEQARGKTVDRRADIWAFGVVLYEMLTGRRAFAGEEISDVLAAVLRQEIDFTALPADVPASVRRLLRRCLEKDPRKRLSAMGDARLELADAGEPAVVPGEPVPAGRRTLLVAAAAGALVMAVAALALWWLIGRPAAPVTGVSRTTILPPEGQVLYPDPAEVALSPDGRWMAIVTGDVVSLSDSQIWIRATGSLTPRRVEGGEGGHLPFWSPDSRRLAFFADGKLKTVSVDGGRPVTVCDAQSGRGGTWNADDVIVFAPDGTGPLFQVPAGGGVPKQVTTLDAARKETGHRFPQFLPDGQHFLYSVLPGHGSTFDVFVGSTSGGARQLVGSFESAPVYVDPGWLVFVRQGTLAAQPFDPARRKLSGEIVAFDDAPGGARDPSTAWTAGPVVAADASGTLAYLTDPVENTDGVWLDADGRVTGTLPLPPGFYNSLAIAPDGTRAAIVRQTSRTESSISLLDLARGTLVPLTSGQSAHSLNQGPLWSPDGTKIVFVSDRDGHSDFFVKDVATNTPTQPFYQSPALFKGLNSWSPDGRRLVFAQMDPDTFQDIWWVPADGKGQATRVVGTPGRDLGGKVSPDGRWLAFASDDANGINIYVQPFPEPGPRVPVTTNGGAEVWWRPDGRQLVVLNGKLTQLLAADVQANGSAFHAGPPHVVATLPKGVVAIDAMPDRRRFLALVPEGEGTPRTVTLLVHWRAALHAGR